MKKYWDHVEIGDALQQSAKAPISRIQIAQFVAAADDFSPLNLDDELAKNAGFRSVYAPGQISLGFIAEALNHFALNLRVLSISGTFQRLMWPGDVLTTNGLLVRRYKKNDEYRVQFSIWCENQNQEVVMKGSVICLLFKNAEQEHKAKLVIPTVSDTTNENLRKKYAHLLVEHKSEKSAARKVLV